MALSERHLDTLLSDTTDALDLLASLSESFKTVELETTAFQAQCEDLLAEQKRLRDLADEVGTNLQYYAYLEPLTRRLNAPGAGRLVRSDDFLDMLMNLDTCIDFMEEHVSCPILVAQPFILPFFSIALFDLISPSRTVVNEHSQIIEIRPSTKLGTHLF